LSEKPRNKFINAAFHLPELPDRLREPLEPTVEPVALAALD
jgi:hypothetical protein